MQHYRHGVAQPALMIVRPHRIVCYSMAVVPTVLNGFGAASRPDIDQVWTALKQAKLGASIQSGSFREQRLYDEPYVRVIIGVNAFTVLLAMAWVGGLASKTACAAAAASGYSLAALCWYHFLQPPKPKLKPAKKASGPPDDCSS